ncbi:MAG: L-threonine ammonia-lyase [Candidatus Levybacteria bacterium GW2011_GWA1_37_16]|nr:MAG: L-threonine ammonia-lyase [Candidatus Levybacteria bacterium GW2011_GWA1_37_16]KKQ42263.1 MAG: L-threonine ammonia-lyase [Candidatus Levybacteria bacterium GW2011_GWB1_37_8]
MNNVSAQTIEEAAKRLAGVIKKTPLQFSQRLSKLYKANIYLKREDLQDVRSYKIRGAYNLMSSLTLNEKKKGVICASAGNHAQGVALSCALLRVKGTIFMPVTTPLQKISRVKHFGDGWTEIKTVGKNFDETSLAAQKYCEEEKAIFVHPFDDDRVISGQGTIAKEIFDKLGKSMDYIICPIGGGGLVSGVGTYLKTKIPNIKLIGVEPKGAQSMLKSIKKRDVVTLTNLDSFVDGTAVKTVGKHTFDIASKLINRIIIVDEGKICATMIDLYQNEGIVAEPAGALSISALDQIAKYIKGKTVVCVLSGGNNDILRYPEIMEKSLAYQGLKHYFLIEFAQKPGQLKQFINHALGPSDDIVRFEYIKKSSKEKGPTLVGIELSKKEDLKKLIENMNRHKIVYTRISTDDPLYSYVI